MSGRDITEGRANRAIAVDIAKSYYKLSESKQKILKLRFASEYADWAKLGEEMNTSADGARMKVQRVLASIVQTLGGWRPYRDQDTTLEEANAGTTEAED